MACQKTPPHGLGALRGPNHVLVSRRSTRAALRSRVRKLLARGRWDDVHIHGLGAALATAVGLAAELVDESGGRLAASTSTSTVALVDRHEPEGPDDDESAQLRHNSAVHIRLFRVASAGE